MDPATIGLAITAASKAFGAIKAGFAAGREIESMGKDLSRWMGAKATLIMQRSLLKMLHLLENYLKVKK